MEISSIKHISDQLASDAPFSRKQLTTPIIRALYEPLLDKDLYDLEIKY